MDIIVTSHKELKSLINEAVSFQLRRFYEENKTSDNKEIYTTSEARDLLKISRTTEHKMNKEGRLTPIWVGGRKKYTREAIENAMKEI